MPLSIIASTEERKSVTRWLPTISRRESIEGGGTDRGFMSMARAAAQPARTHDCCFSEAFSLPLRSLSACAHTPRSPRVSRWVERILLSLFLFCTLPLAHSRSAGRHRATTGLERFIRSLRCFSFCPAGGLTGRSIGQHAPCYDDCARARARHDDLHLVLRDLAAAREIPDSVGGGPPVV